MNRLSDTFRRLRKEKRKAFIPFVTGGDPDLKTTASLLLALQKSGADAIEVGIPFSDPLADGPVIQASSMRALKRGTTPAQVLKTIASVKNKLSVPVLCLSYWNPILQFQAANGANVSGVSFLKAASKAGVSGLIIPDLPVEEATQFKQQAERWGIATIFLAAPTSPPQRLRAIARTSEGFVYYVSLTGTTGIRQELSPELRHGVRQLKLLTIKPVCVGFGISTPKQAAAVCRVADGVIVGSALVRTIAEGPKQAAVKRAGAFARRIRNAIDGS